MLPHALAGAEDPNISAMRLQLEETVKQLIAVCTRQSGRQEREKYEKVKQEVLSPELAKQVNEVDTLYDRFLASIHAARDRGLDLNQIVLIGNVQAEFILFTPYLLDNTTIVTRIRYSRMFDEAKVSLLRDVPVEDDPGKVWSPYKEEVELFFRYVNGKWLLHEATFDIPEDYSGFSTLTKRLADRNSPERQAIAEVWEKKLSAGKTPKGKP